MWKVAKRSREALRGRKLRMLPLLAATYFMVSGGPYGLEEIIGDAGYGWALIILFVLPFFWSLPTSLMIGELAARGNLQERRRLRLCAGAAMVDLICGLSRSVACSFAAPCFDMAFHRAALGPLDLLRGRTSRHS